MIRASLVLTSLALPLCFVSSIRGEPFRPNLGPERETVLATCGEVSVLLRRASQWTPGRFDYRGDGMTTEQSAYGTVFRFPDIGFIGTAHLENEPEQLLSVRFFADDREIDIPEDRIVAEESFRFLRDSRIRQFRLRNEIEIAGDRITETTTVSTDEAAELELVYHFMHAWNPSISAYVAGKKDEGIVERGRFADEGDTVRKFFVNAEVDWIGVFDPGLRKFAVSRLLESPPEVAAESKIWNVPPTYRKYYLTSFFKKTVPAGFNGTWKMVTGFGESTEEEWEAAATRLAEDLVVPN